MFYYVRHFFLIYIVFSSKTKNKFNISGNYFKALRTSKMEFYALQSSQSLDLQFATFKTFLKFFGQDETLNKNFVGKFLELN